jgi:hypothetical protein
MTNAITMIKARIMIWAGHVVCMGDSWHAYRIFVAKHEGKMPLRRHRHKWKGDIRMNLGEIG